MYKTSNSQNTNLKTCQPSKSTAKQLNDNEIIAPFTPFATSSNSNLPPYRNQPISAYLASPPFGRANQRLCFESVL